METDSHSQQTIAHHFVQQFFFSMKEKFSLVNVTTQVEVTSIPNCLSLQQFLTQIYFICLNK